MSRWEEYKGGGGFRSEYYAALARDVLARQSGEVKWLNHPEVTGLTIEQIKLLDNPQYRPPSPQSSEYDGVSFHKGRNKWRATLSCNGKKVYKGFFNSEYHAALARDYLVRESSLSKRLNHPEICLTLEEIKDLDKSLAE